jgi:outer membrane protein W
MKHILLVSSLLSMGLLLKAQTNQGDWMVGGNLNINTAKNNSTFAFNPNAGYFFADNFVAGAQLGFEATSFGDVRITGFSVGPFARYYFNIKDDKLKPFVNGSVGFITEKTKTKVNNNTDEVTTNTATSAFLGLGAAYFINSNVALEGVAGYVYNKFENRPATNGFGLRIGFQIHLLGSEVKRK